MTTTHRVPGTQTGAPPRTYAFADNTTDDRTEAERWGERARIVLTPVAAPSILGLFGFFAATLLVGSHMAGWWGNAMSPVLVFPFALMLGGVAQFLAGMWAYRARDGLATAMHGIWGTFWLAFGLYQLMVSTGNLPAVTTPLDVSFGFWFIPMACITGFGALAAVARHFGLFLVLGPLATGSGFAAAGFIAGAQWCLYVAGWLFVVAAAAALYSAGGQMLRESYGRTILPTGELKAAANIPGRQPSEPIEYEGGMPGSRAGQ